MQAVRQVVDRKDIKSIFVPEEFGKSLYASTDNT